ncbi:hypothetical protein S1OALGB6SA_2326 [Olavius algarvensis spirochete endosymbiont]|nr:hypothetical protein S1OALGB6SA_2326 [Olavius algarvensis spirochete endosymbiont]
MNACFLVEQSTSDMGRTIIPSGLKKIEQFSAAIRFFLRGIWVQG